MTRLKEAIGPTLPATAYGRLTERLSDGAIDRLADVLEDPSEATWDRACSLIIGLDRYTTLWQAVMRADPTFPLFGPVHEAGTGRRIRGWARIPDRETLVKAIRLTTT